MMNLRQLLSLMAILASLSINADEISLTDGRRTFFAEQPASLTILIPDTEDASQVHITMSYSGRTLLRKSVDAKPRIVLPFEFPALKAGVIANASLAISVVDSNDKPLIKKTVKLFMFPEKTAPEQKSAKTDPLGLYSLGEPAVANMLDHLGIDHTTVRTLDGFTGSRLICSGIDFDKSPGIAKALHDHVQAGRHVILLPPIRGAFALRQDDQTKLTLGGTERIRHFDKRYDRESWGPNAPLIMQRLRLISKHDRVAVDMHSEAGPWSSLQLQSGKGSLDVLPWNFTAHYRTNPTAAYLLHDLLSTQPTKGKE